MRTLHRFAREVGGRVRYDEQVLSDVLNEWEIDSMATLANLDDSDRRSISLRVLDAVGEEAVAAR